MSQSIWTQCGASSSCRPLQLDAWRVVEAQHQNSTRKLVESDEEQALLEELIDGVKPKIPKGLEHLHYLLATPFRHPPLRNGSRFGTTSQRGIWYGARTTSTCLAEVAYYRHVFFAASSAKLDQISVELTAFKAVVQCTRGVDLTTAPFDAHRVVLASPVDYTATQQLGGEMRAAGVEAFCFTSARDLAGGTNVGLFAPAFAATHPTNPQTWICTTDPMKVEIVRKNVFKQRPEETLTFPRTTFEIDGVLPQPATR